MDWLTFFSGVIVAAIGAGALFYRLRRRSIEVSTLVETVEALSARSKSQETLIKELRQLAEDNGEKITSLQEEMAKIRLEKGELELDNRRLRQALRDLHTVAVTLEKALKQFVPTPGIVIPNLCELLGSESN